MVPDIEKFEFNETDDRSEESTDSPLDRLDEFEDLPEAEGYDEELIDAEKSWGWMYKKPPLWAISTPQ